jgi:hypothetical protein
MTACSGRRPRDGEHWERPLFFRLYLRGGYRLADTKSGGAGSAT